MDNKTLNTVETLIDVFETVFNRYNYTSRPTGYDFMSLVLVVATNIAYSVNPDDITPEVREILTNENYHTLTHAIDIVKHLSKYA